MPECPRCGASHEEHARFCSACGYHLGPASDAGPLEVRKQVTVAFCDLVGSTRLGERLDPEPLAALLQRYFDLTASIFTEHGGVVREFIGDAVLAVFGVPASREDDAVRALRATLQILQAIDRLNDELGDDLRLQVRIGVNTGEVLAGRSSAGQPLLLGDALNVAARLERRADPGQILLGEDTRSAAWGLAETDPIGDVAVEGRREPVRAYRLRSVRTAPAGDATLVGRRAELSALVNAFDEVVGSGAPRVSVVVGEPGVGKSRLLREFRGAVEGRARSATATVSSYGSSTFSVIAELVADAERGTTDDDRGSALGELLAGDPPPTVDDVAEAAAAQLSRLAGIAPLVLVIEDVHWAPRSLEELVAALVRMVRGPVLVLATSRPEGWTDPPAGRDAWAVLRLEPLAGPEAMSLIEAALPDAGPGRRRRVAEIARGNPLFIVESVRALRERGEPPRPTGDDPIPTTLRSLMEARLERLEPTARIALEPAAVAGEVVSMTLVRRTSTAPGDLAAGVAQLIDRSILAPSEGGELAFSHPLLREAAYRSIPKLRRAELHLALADAWADGFRQGADDVDLVIGTHVANAVDCRADLHVVEGRDPLAARAARHLFDVGSRAFAAGDAGLASELFERVAGLMGPDDPLGAEARVQAAFASAERGVWSDAERWCDEVLAYGHRHDDDVIRARADVARGRSWMGSLDPRMYDVLPTSIAAAIDVLERAGDHEALALAWFVACVPPWNDLDADGCLAALDRSAEHARLAGCRALELEARGAQTPGWLRGPMPAGEAVDRCAALLLDDEANARMRFRVELARAELLAMLGRFEDAWDLMDQVDELSRRLYGSVQLINVEFRYHLHKHAGDPAGALRSIEGWASGLPAPAVGFLECLRARCFVELGRDDDARRALDASDRAMHPGDRAIRVYLASLRGLLRVRAGDLDGGLDEARGGVELADLGDFAIERGDSRRWLAEALREAGRPDDAVVTASEALWIYRAKGVAPWVERTEAMLTGWSAPIAG